MNMQTYSEGCTYHWELPIINSEILPPYQLKIALEAAPALSKGPQNFPNDPAIKDLTATARGRQDTLEHYHLN